MKIIQFQGETRRDAVVNYYALDIVEEESFEEFLQSKGHSFESDDETIDALHDEWLIESEIQEAIRDISH